MSTTTEEQTKPKLTIPENAIVTIVGFRKCRNYIRANQTAEKLLIEKPDSLRYITWCGDRDSFHTIRPIYLQQLNMEPDQHKTSPLVFITDATLQNNIYVGGASDFCDIVQSQFGVEPAPLGPKLE